jgi:hypothetical protein
MRHTERAFRFATYSGSLPTRPGAAGAGRFVLKSGQWEVHFDGEDQYSHGRINRYALSAVPASVGATLTMTDAQDPTGGFVLTLPEVNPRDLTAAITKALAANVGAGAVSFIGEYLVSCPVSPFTSGGVRGTIGYDAVYCSGGSG